MRIVILGAGVSGLAAAIKFQSQGHKVTVIEKQTIGSNLGGGIDIHPNGTKILLSLGIEERFKELSSYNNREIRISDATGKTLNCVPLNLFEKNGQYPLASFFRKDIIQMLFAKAHGCHFYENTDCTALEVQEEGVELTLDQSVKLQADVVIAADGINSIARRTFFPDGEKKYLGHISFGGCIPRSKYNHNYIHGLQKTCVVFPCSKELAHTVMFCPKPQGWLREHRNFDEQKELFLGWSKEVDAIVANLQPENRFCVESYEIPPLKSYVFKRIFLVGDAAHAMSPLGALATTLALEDVQELAEQFAIPQSLNEIGDHYNQKRLPRAEQYRNFSINSLVPAITSHGPEDYKKRMERFSSVAPEKVFEPLIKLTQDNVDA